MLNRCGKTRSLGRASWIVWNRESKLVSWQASLLSAFPLWIRGFNPTSCSKSLQPWLPWTLRQNKLSSPKVAFFREFYRRDRKQTKSWLALYLQSCLFQSLETKHLLNFARSILCDIRIRQGKPGLPRRALLTFKIKHPSFSLPGMFIYTTMYLLLAQLSRKPSPRVTWLQACWQRAEPAGRETKVKTFSMLPEVSSMQSCVCCLTWGFLEVSGAI